MMTTMLVVARDVVLAGVAGSLPAVRLDEVEFDKIVVARVVVSAAMSVVDDCKRVEDAVWLTLQKEDR